MPRSLRILTCLASLTLLAFLGRNQLASQSKPQTAWQLVAPGLFVSPELPHAHAIVSGDHAIVFDAPRGADLEALDAKVIDAVYLTHHHRDTCARAADWISKSIPVFAPKASADWLLPEPVAKFWRESIPLRNSRTAYLVVPEGIKEVQCTLTDGQKMAWREWTIEVVATPGHSPDHVAYSLRKDKEPPIIICGDSIASTGKIWTPYTTDWDHWTDLGQKPAAASLRKLMELRPRMLCPAHGPVIDKDPVNALEKTATALEEAGFLKSFERYSKERVGNPPDYPFLAKEQAGTGGEKPWSQLSPHLYLTGNTYVLVSKDHAIAVADPWGKRSAEQIQKLQQEKGLGPVELVTFSHAHFDHYDGIYELPERDHFKVWTLDRVAEPIGEPFYYRAPFLDARPVRIDRRMKDGEQATWREYTFRFRHFPGQTFFTMAMETEIDGRKCFFAADNFFHVDLYSGTGGWMGLNRSWPSFYATSAEMVLKARPDWILGEHGGACAFNEEDWKRRMAWGQAAASAADALSPSGNHRHDWDPHRIHLEPFVVKGKRGENVEVKLATSNPLNKGMAWRVSCDANPAIERFEAGINVAAGQFSAVPLKLVIKHAAPAGRTIVPVVVDAENCEDSSDVVLVVDVD